MTDKRTVQLSDGTSNVPRAADVLRRAGIEAHAGGHPPIPRPTLASEPTATFEHQDQAVPLSANVGGYGEDAEWLPVITLRLHDDGQVDYLTIRGWAVADLTVQEPVQPDALRYGRGEP